MKRLYIKLILLSLGTIIIMLAGVAVLCGSVITISISASVSFKSTSSSGVTSFRLVANVWLEGAKTNTGTKSYIASVFDEYISSNSVDITFSLPSNLILEEYIKFNFEIHNYADENIKVYVSHTNQTSNGVGLAYAFDEEEGINLDSTAHPYVCLHCSHLVPQMDFDLEIQNIPLPNGDFITTTNGSNITLCSYTGNSEFILPPKNITMFNNNSQPIFPTTTKAVKLSSSITGIGKNSFINCSNLDNLYISQNIANIDSSAFAYCSNLKLTVDENTKFKNKNGILYQLVNNGNSQIILFADKQLKFANITPTVITSLSKYCFSNCNKLETVTLGNNVTSVSDFAFAGCNNIKLMTVSNSGIGFSTNCLSSSTPIYAPNGISSNNGHKVYRGNSLANSVVLTSIPESWHYYSLATTPVYFILKTTQNSITVNLSSKTCSTMRVQLYMVTGTKKVCDTNVNLPYNNTFTTAAGSNIIANSNYYFGVRELAVGEHIFKIS